MKELIEYLNDCKGKNTLVLAHDDADADAVGAAYALSEALHGRVGVPEKVAEHSYELMEKLDMTVVFAPDLKKEDIVIVVDTADEKQLPGIDLGKYLIIDHHSTNNLLEGALSYYHERTDSTCQLVFQILSKMGIKINRKMCLAMAAGILGDTIYLERSKGNTIKILGEILITGNIEFKDALNMLRVSHTLMREKRLEAALNSDLYKINDYLIAFTKTDREYIYYVAMMLLEMGADIAIATYQESNEVGIRMVKHQRLKEVKLDLYRLMKKGIVGTEIDNLWGNEYFVGFQGKGDGLAITKQILKNITLQKS